MTDPTLFDAQAARDEGMGRAEDHAAPDWKDLAATVALGLALDRPTFTADDVWDVLGSDAPSTHDGRALGPVLVNLARQGRIRRVGYAPSRRRHASPIAEWAAIR
jgi:hypothetical protein